MKFSITLLLYNFLILLASSILSLLIVPILPFLLIYRLFIVKCSKFFRPDLESIVSGWDIIFAFDFRLWDTKPKVIVSATITLQSTLKVEKVKTHFEEAVADKNLERLCQYIVPWMGFAFWKREKDFSLENHIFVVNDENGVIHDDKWLDDFTKKMSRKPFGKMQSPWAVYIISNYQPTPGTQTQSAFIFRHHHSLLDGYSTLKLFANAYDNYMPINYESSNKATAYSGIKLLTSWLSTPYKVLKFTLDTTEWNLKLWNKFSGEFCCGSVIISMEKIFLIRQKYEVGVNAIFYAGVTAAFRNILLRSNSKIPETISLAIVIPKKNHPDHLCNHFIAASLPIPVGTLDPVERLMKINFDYDNFTASGISEMIGKLEEINGLLPYRLAHFINLRLSAVVSIVPLGSQNEFFGCPVGEYRNVFPVPVTTMNSGMVIFGVINNGFLHLRGTFDKTILSSDKVSKEVMEGIDEYYDSLLIN